MAAPQDRLTIGQLAQIGGVNLETIRYYERAGLLPKPPRTVSGYRLFPPDAPRRLQFIKRTQELGFSLAEIRDLLSLRVRKEASRADIRTRADAKLADIVSRGVEKAPGVVVGLLYHVRTLPRLL